MKGAATLLIAIAIGSDVPAEPEVPGTCAPGLHFYDGRCIQYPVIRKRVVPRAPAQAVSAKAASTVILKAVIERDGSVRDPVVLRSHRPGLGFEQAAIAAVRKWRYEPALADGEPVSIYVEIHVDFQRPLRRKRPGIEDSGTRNLLRNLERRASQGEREAMARLLSMFDGADPALDREVGWILGRSVPGFPKRFLEELVSSGIDPDVLCPLLLDPGPEFGNDAANRRTETDRRRAALGSVADEALLGARDACLAAPRP